MSEVLRAKPPCDFRAGDGMIFRAALGDVMQEHGHVENRAVVRPDLPHQIAGDRELFIAAALDVLKDADAAEQVLVHRVVMIHIELHHRDDLAEGADELSEHTGLVHAPQHRLRVR